jgi:hypothetical protein
MTTTNNTVRVATVKATGEKFIVNALDFKANVARCWGQVVACAGARTTHEAGGPVFALADVSVETLPRTNALAVALFQQTLASRRAAGHVVTTTRKGNATDHGTPAEIAARKAAAARFNADLVATMPPAIVAMFTGRR